MKKIVLLISLLSIVSCKDIAADPIGNNFYFENPQPINDSELSKIPRKFRGRFINSDSSFLNVKENVILSEHFFKFKIHKNEIDSLKSEFDYVNGMFISKKSKDVFETINRGDSLELFEKIIDTFFVFSNSQKMKQISNALILNEKDSVFWRFKILSFENNKLSLKHVYSDEDLKKFDSITKIKSQKIDSASFILRPTRREFKKLIKLDYFGDVQQFKKVGK